MLIESAITSVLLLLYCNAIRCETESNHSDANRRDDDDYYIKDPKDDRKLRWMTLTADYWKNHKNPYYNYLLAKSRESKSNPEPYFAEPVPSERYESAPSAVQITAIPANGFAGSNNYGYNNYGSNYGGYGFERYGERYGEPFDPPPQPPWPPQKFPVFVINKTGGGKELGIKWLIPLLLLLGLPLFCGLLFIPLLLQGAFFFLAIFRNLGFLLPLIPALTGNGMNGLNGMNPVIPATG